MSEANGAGARIKPDPDPYAEWAKWLRDHGGYLLIGGPFGSGGRIERWAWADGTILIETYPGTRVVTIHAPLLANTPDGQRGELLALREARRALP